MLRCEQTDDGDFLHVLTLATWHTWKIYIFLMSNGYTLYGKRGEA